MAQANIHLRKRIEAVERLTNLTIRTDREARIANAIYWIRIRSQRECLLSDSVSISSVSELPGKVLSSSELDT